MLVRAGPQQMTGVDIRVGDSPSPTAGAVCKAGDSFDPGVGKVIPCARVLKVWQRWQAAAGCLRRRTGGL